MAKLVITSTEIVLEDFSENPTKLFLNFSFSGRFIIYEKYKSSSGLIVWYPIHDNRIRDNDLIHFFLQLYPNGELELIKMGERYIPYPIIPVTKQQILQLIWYKNLNETQNAEQYIIDLI